MNSYSEAHINLLVWKHILVYNQHKNHLFNTAAKTLLLVHGDKIFMGYPCFQHCLTFLTNVVMPAFSYENIYSRKTRQKLKESTCHPFSCILLDKCTLCLNIIPTGHITTEVMTFVLTPRIAAECLQLTKQRSTDFCIWITSKSLHNVSAGHLNI